MMDELAGDDEEIDRGRGRERCYASSVRSLLLSIVFTSGLIMKLLLGIKSSTLVSAPFPIFLLDDHAIQDTQPPTPRSRTDYAFLIRSIHSLDTIYPPSLC